MKKKLLSVLLITALGASLLAGCSSEKDSVSDKTEKKVEEKLTKVTLNEVAHSIFLSLIHIYHPAHFLWYEDKPTDP